MIGYIVASTLRDLWVLAKVATALFIGFVAYLGFCVVMDRLVEYRICHISQPRIVNEWMTSSR